MNEPTKIGSTKYSIDLYFVNANSNEIELVKEQKGTVIACGFELPKIVKKNKDWAKITIANTV